VSGEGLQAGVDPTIAYFPKSEEDEAQIRSTIKSNAFFAHLDDECVSELTQAIFPKHFQEGEVVMNQGDMGDNLYIVQDGQAGVFVLSAKTKKEDLVRVCNSGDTFGEISLMYSCPRTATVRAQSALKCWCVDRLAFTQVVLKASINKRDAYETFLRKVAAFSNLNQGEIHKLIDALMPRKVAQGVTIIKEGEEVAQIFYIIEKGSVVVTQRDEKGIDRVVNRKGPGDYFGEVALLENKPRNATVMTSEDSVLLCLERETFDAILGPLKAIMERNYS